MIIQSCSWCHEMNEIVWVPAYCDTCGHRADVARAECDCHRCQHAREVIARIDRQGAEVE